MIVKPVDYLFFSDNDLAEKALMLGKVSPEERTARLGELLTNSGLVKKDSPHRDMDIIVLGAAFHGVDGWHARSPIKPGLIGYLMGDKPVGGTDASAFLKIDKDRVEKIDCSVLERLRENARDLRMNIFPLAHWSKEEVAKLQAIGSGITRNPEKRARKKRNHQRRKNKHRQPH